MAFAFQTLSLLCGGGGGGGGGEEEGEGSDRSGVITRATDLYEVAILHMVLMGLLRTFCQG